MSRFGIGFFVSCVVSSFSLGAANSNLSLHFKIDPMRDVKPISRFIYGINQSHGVVDGLNGPWSNAGFVRIGGNRFTAYNWTNNGSNAGNDFHFENDDYLVSGPVLGPLRDVPGGAVIPTIETAAEHHAAAMVTIPINGLVSADTKLVANVKKAGGDYVHTFFKTEQPKKGSAFTLTPDPSSPIVYEDEFVNWVVSKYPYGSTDADRPIWFSLDNEPDWWSHTHSEIHPKPATYAELVEKSIAYAAAAKDVSPNSLIFGPVNYGWSGYVTLQEATDKKLGDFQEYYLKQMAAAENEHGHRLLDVFDIHWYPEARGGGERIMDERRPTTSPAVIEARLQAPRSLWDSTYTETSWIAKDSTKGPINLLPRMREKIAKNYPGTKLAITEYDYGGGTHISGGIAEADVLGIFGREGVFAAAIWPGRNIPFTEAGFEMFRNFDGKNGSFGDVSVHAETNNVGGSSVYASVDAKSPGRMVIVLINKAGHEVNGSVELPSGTGFSTAQVFQLTAAAAHPVSAGTISRNGDAPFVLKLPGYSIETLELGAR